MNLSIAVNRAEKCRAMVRDYDEHPHPDPVKHAVQRQAWVDALAVRGRHARARSGRMNAVDQHKRAFDDHCPLCGEGVTEDDHTILDEINVWCGVERASFDVGVLPRSWQ